MSEKVELIKERDKLFIRSQHLAQDKETLQKENQELKLRNSYLEQLEKSITEDVKKAELLKANNSDRKKLIDEILTAIQDGDTITGPMLEDWGQEEYGIEHRTGAEG